MGADLEVLAGVLVLEGGPDHAVHVLLRGQRHRAGDGGAGTGGSLHDLPRGGLDRGGVVRLQANADLVLGGRCHWKGAGKAQFSRWVCERSSSHRAAAELRRRICLPMKGAPSKRRPWHYSMISLTTPEPTV